MLNQLSGDICYIRTRRRFDELQDWLTDFGSCVFIAEGHQVMVANHHVPPTLLSIDRRLYQTLIYQNCTTSYLPGRT